jgi:MYXO-CTERM domain-containing protein
MADNIVSMDSHANAPFILKAIKLLADQVNGNTPPLEIFSYWVISDVFDESSGPSGSYILGHNEIPFGQVFGMMNFQGLRKSAFNAFKMLNYLGPEQLAVSGGSGDPDGVDGMASISAAGDEVAVILYNYYATVLTSGSDSVTVNVDNLPFAGQEMYVTKFVIDEGHSNPYGVWLGQGSPTTPSEAQWQELRAAQHLALAEPVTTATASSSYSTTMDLPRQGAALILLSQNRPLTGRNALVEMEGEDYDGQSGATKEDSNDESLGQSITLAAGGNVFFLNVDFRDTGVDSLALRVNAQSETTLELHADTQDGTLMGTCTIPATGGWATEMCDLTQTEGVHTLYLVAGAAPLRLNWMKFGAGEVVVGSGGAGGTGATATSTTDASTATTTTGTGGTAGTGTATVTGGDTSAGTSTTGSGTLTCTTPLQACAGACVDLSSDAANCRACGAACREGQVCSAGVCATSCGAGLTQCGQNCVDLMSSLVSCGSCDLSCGQGQSCTNGMCVGGPEQQKQASGKGGCGCRIGSQSNGPQALLFGSLLLGLFAGRRRRPRPGRKASS